MPCSTDLLLLRDHLNYGHVPSNLLTTACKSSSESITTTIVNLGCMTMTNYQDSMQIPHQNHMHSNPEVIQGHYSPLPMLIILQLILDDFSITH